MLRTYAAPPWVVGSVLPKLGFVQKGELPGHLEGVCSLEVVLPGGMNMASCLISMVFEDFQPESPGVNVLARERPCLEHVQQSGMRVGQPLAYVLNLIFHWRQFKLPGVSTPPERKPCLSNLLPLRRLVQHTC